MSILPLVSRKTLISPFRTEIGVATVIVTSEEPRNASNNLLVILIRPTRVVEEVRKEGWIWMKVMMLEFFPRITCIHAHSLEY